MAGTTENNQIAYLPEGIIKNIQERIRIDKFTPLQEKVFNSEKFWNQKKNLIIQGTTSSGKTLIAEVAAAHCIFSSAERMNVIYLVPLRAMVSEKYKQFTQDMGQGRYAWNIYASSSDYQNSDREIMDGDFHLAVIVYEKFFSLLAQSSRDFLAECGLVIVDEIQMLSDSNRGPKLEFSLTKLKQYFPNAQIMGLTTIYCDTKEIGEWLDAENITDPLRTVDLYENIVIEDGTCITKIETAQQGKVEKNIVDDDRLKNFIETRDNKKKQNLGKNSRKQNLMFNIVRYEIGQCSDAKIIVFTQSKRNTEQLAKLICNSGIFDKEQLSRELAAKLLVQDDDEIIRKLREEYFPYGVAYHNSSLPKGTRELIEDEFLKSNGQVRLIVATETLAIGLNLPADIIIMYDTKVKKDGKIVEILPHEYKNYVGRAGRLGITDKAGKSYLLANNNGEMSHFLDFYVNAQATSIQSAFTKLEKKKKAPYYLNILAGKQTSDNTITYSELKEFVENSFQEHNFDEDKDIEEILDELAKSKLTNREPRYDDYFEEEEEKFSITAIGRALSPFALSLSTCRQIIIFFLQDGYRFESRKYAGGLPADYSNEDMEKKKYVLDILYRVCLMDEVTRINSLQMPDSNQQNYGKLVGAIDSYILNAKKTDQLWDNSPLNEFLDEKLDLDKKFETAILRAIILKHWVNGETPNQIRKNTKIDIPFTIGDLDHIAEVASYILEAISHCLMVGRLRNGEKRDNKLKIAMYYFSSQVKYGLGGDLVRIANRHVSGITRKTIINMGAWVKKNGSYENVVDFIMRAPDIITQKFINTAQKSELIDLLDQPMCRGNINELSEKLLREALISNKLYDLCTTYLDSNIEYLDFIECLLNILKEIGFSVMEGTVLGTYSCIAQNEKKFQIVIPKFDDENQILNKDNFWGYSIETNNSNKTIIICKQEFENNVFDESNILMIGYKSFLGLLLHCHYISNTNHQVLINVLQDLSGEFRLVDLEKLMGVVKNYIVQVEGKSIENPTSLGKHVVYILYDREETTDVIKEFIEICKKNNIYCKHISWGGDETSYIEEVYNSCYNVFVYIDNEIQLQSNFIKVQIDTIEYHKKDRKIFVLWKDNEIKELFYKKYPYFSKMGHVRDEQSLEDIVELMKKSLEE